MRGGVFQAAAGVYDLLTDTEIWRDQARAMLRHGPPAPRRVLDVGCGPGASAFALAEVLGGGAQVVGVDLAAAMVARARRHQRRGAAPAVRFLVGDATRLPFPSGSFDLVTGHSFLYLVPDPLAVLAEVRRVLAPGGGLVLLEPSRRGSLRRAAAHALGRGGAALQQPVAATRFVTSMVVWRVYSGLRGRLDPQRVEGWLTSSGFVQAGSAPTLGGLAVHCFGRAP
jgi:ubiquinone/menaquinone biosynthesis C-methylase UbiE